MNHLHMIRYTREEVEIMAELAPLAEPKERLKGNFRGFLTVMETASAGLAVGLFFFLIAGLVGGHLSDRVVAILFLGLPALFFLIGLLAFLWHQAQQPDVKTAREDLKAAWRRLSYLSTIPAEYWSFEALSRFEAYIEEGRASTVEECIALYAQEGGRPAHPFSEAQPLV